MPNPTERFRSIRVDRRSKVALRSLFRGDSIWIRVAIFLAMSAVFFLLVTITQRNRAQSPAGNDQLNQQPVDSNDTAPPRTGSAQRPPSPRPSK